MTTSDMQLLREYVTGQSDDAFGALVARHLNLVYSVALRVLGDTHQAEEVAQSVFLTLARKSASLDSETVVSGWLYHTARLTAANFVRTEIRRRHREEQAQMEAAMNENEAGPQVWEQVAPQLEQAMSELNEKERDAIVLRFFEGKRLREVGDALGISEDAAKMRVGRALDKLRNFFIGRGITVPEALLAAALADNSIIAAPAGLGTTITAGVAQAAATGAAVATPTILKGVLYTMSTVKISIAIGACAAAIIAWQCHEVSSEKQTAAHLQEQIAAATQTSAQQTQEIARLEKEVESYRKSAEAMARDAAKSRANAVAARQAKAMAEEAKKLAASSGGNGLAAMFKDPDVVRAMREQAAATIRLQYAPLVQQLHLSDDKAEAFYQLLIAKGMQGIDALQSGNLAEPATNSLEPQLRGVLGDDGFAQYKDFVSSLGDTTMLNTIKNSFVDEPLTDQQQQQLLQAMKTARQSTPAPAGGNYSTLNAVGQAAQADDFVASQEAINQNVLQQAQAFLSSNQLQTLGAAQSNFLNMEKVGMTMAKKMFPNTQGGTATAQSQ